jgi:hypothetical protein
MGRDSLEVLGVLGRDECEIVEDVDEVGECERWNAAVMGEVLAKAIGVRELCGVAGSNSKSGKKKS